MVLAAAGCLVFTSAGSGRGASAAPAPIRLLILGNSLTAGYGLPAGDAFQARLAASLRAHGRDVAIVDGAVSGDTSAGGRARLDWTIAAGVDAAMVELGANDGLRGLDPGQMQANLTAILDALAARNIPVLLTGMYAPPNLGAAYGQAFRAVFDRLGKRPGVIYDPFFLAGVAAQPALTQPDGLHPNAAGVQREVARIEPLVGTAAGRGETLMRLFVGLDLPRLLRDRLALLCGGVPGARWMPTENYHLTLRFVGEVPAHRAEEIDHALSGVIAGAFPLSFTGVGVFSKAGRAQSLWAGVERSAGLDHLQSKIETALQRSGQEPERRRFTPHVTLARLGDGVVEAKLAGFVQAHNLFRAGPFEVEHFTLFSSRLGKEASAYTAEVEYPLQPRRVGAAA